MKRFYWLFFIMLVAAVFSVGFSPVEVLAQEEEEEEIMPKGPDDRPNPMDRTMRKGSSRGSQLMLKNGQMLQQGMQGGKQVWFLVGKNGQKALANGSYTLQNGQRMSVQRGVMNQRQMNQMQMQKQMR